VLVEQVGELQQCLRPLARRRLEPLGQRLLRRLDRPGDVVGTASGHAFVYLRASNEFIDLNTAISASTAATWTLISATGINDDGVICGQARRLATPADGPDYGMYVYRAFKLRPFPIFYFPLPLTLAP
jgi:hypothetical protein